MATTLQQLEVAAHLEFPDREPSLEELAAFFRKRLQEYFADPVSIAALAISVAALALQAWSAYQDSKPKCPICGRPAVAEDKKTGKLRCNAKPAHTW